jgi:N,N-dimethylformamidase
VHPLLGYVDRWSVKPGGRLALKVGSKGNTPFETRIARILCGDPNPKGPGYREIKMPHPTDGRHPGKEQGTHLGSWARIPALDLTAAAKTGFVLAVTLWPTTPRKGRQGVVAWTGADGTRIALEIDRQGAAATVTAGGRTTSVATGKPLLERAWYDVWLTLDIAGKTLAVGQRPRDGHPGFADAGEASTPLPSAPALGHGAAVFAALPGSPWPSAHYNGKIERPTIWLGTGAAAALAAQQAPVDKGRPAGRHACWDFSIGIPTFDLADIGPHGFNGLIENLPDRAMTGSNWSGKEHRWTHLPEEWGAIHFHDDDLGDVGWETSLDIEIPKDWPSGMYCVHLKSAHGIDNVPFVVRPADGAKRAKIAILLPTITYHVYSQFVRPGFGAQNRARAEAWGALTQQPDENPELGLSPYNYHSDGSGVTHATMARPMVDKRFNHFIMLDQSSEIGSGTYWLNVDSYIVDWLTRKGFEHDIVTDHDLHAEGADLLKPYALVITCQHPEYHTDQTLDGLEGYLAGGGRLFYLGGNGFYWKAVFHPQAPWAMEVRRAESGVRVWATEVGEGYHAFDGSYGGLWRRIGRSSHKLVGISFTAQGTYNGHPYKTTDGIMDPRVAFLRQGIENQLTSGIAIGERGHMGGGAAGHELDRIDYALGTPRHALVVAEGHVLGHPEYGPVNEDRLTQFWPGTPEDLMRADLTFFETPAGGAVLSVGSMCFVGALPVDNYDNLLTRMMTNAVRRFIDPKPFTVPPLASDGTVKGPTAPDGKPAGQKAAPAKPPVTSYR